MIHEEHHLDHVSAADLDRLLAAGCRHFGPLFFRSRLGVLPGGGLARVVPLRAQVADCWPGKNLRRVLTRNRDLEVRVRPAGIDGENTALFWRHATRFTDNVPDRLESFLGPRPDLGPTTLLEVQVRLGPTLLAASFLDVGETAASSVYGVFEPAHARRGLGWLTILREVELARALGKTFYYLGYAYDRPSHYDYKRRLPALEHLVWATGEWELGSGGDDDDNAAGTG